jgi:hypothetical protein
MKIKLKLDSKKALKAAIAIAATYGLCRVSEGTKSPQLAAANALTLIAMIAILYGPCPVPKNSLKITLRTNMHGYYAQVDSIPQYIIMMEEAQKKAKRAGISIANIKIIMMASAAVLAVQHFPHKVDDWEGLPDNSCSWAVWKIAFRLTHLKCQHQI